MYDSGEIIDGSDKMRSAKAALALAVTVVLAIALFVTWPEGGHKHDTSWTDRHDQSRALGPRIVSSFRQSLYREPLRLRVGVIDSSINTRTKMTDL